MKKEKEVGEKIRTLRQSLKLSQSEFAEKIGSSQAQVSYWEQGRWLISTEYLYEICLTFGISLQYFDLKTDKEIFVAEKN